MPSEVLPLPNEGGVQTALVNSSSGRPKYYRRCERDGLEPDQVWLFEEDLEPDKGGPIEIEQPSNIVTTPLSMSDQEDRIRSVLGLTSNDPLPESDDEWLLVYHEYLTANLSCSHSRQGIRDGRQRDESIS